jgi:hypothetical protein
LQKCKTFANGRSLIERILDVEGVGMVKNGKNTCGLGKRMLNEMTVSVNKKSTINACCVTLLYVGNSDQHCAGVIIKNNHFFNSNQVLRSCQGQGKGLSVLTTPIIVKFKTVEFLPCNAEERST